MVAKAKTRLLTTFNFKNKEALEIMSERIKYRIVCEKAAFQGSVEIQV